MSGIGRLPTAASAGSGLTRTVEVDELDLLEQQLSTTVNLPKPYGVGRFASLANNQAAGNTIRHGPVSTSIRANFSTFPRRRQKPKSIMTLWHDRQLLDEIQSEGLRHLLANVQLQWDFSAFSLDRLSNGSNLPTLCTYLFLNHNLISRFRLDSLTTWKFFAMVERGYHSSNPYHTGVHAADVTQAIACFVAEPDIIKYLSPCEILASLIAAACHDIDHPGLNEKFLIASSSHLAGLYGDASVLENHHWRSAISILWESGFAHMLSKDDRLEMESIIKSMILATDISRQAEFLALLRQYQDTGEMDLSVTKYRHFILQIALKCADISNPCRSWNICRLWSYRACEEFFRQGDRERNLGLPIAMPICDRQNISIAKVQSGFYRFIALPLFEEWNRFLSSPLSRLMLNNLTSNQARWDLIVQREAARSAAMAESVVSHSSSSSGGGSIVGGDNSRRESLDPHISHHRLSRSSADGEDDPEAFNSVTNMQFEINPLAGGTSRVTLATTMCSTRRHSLPVQAEFLAKQLTTTLPKPNMDEPSSSTLVPFAAQTGRHPSLPSNSSPFSAHFVRQYSFGERRRSLKQPCVVADPQYVAATMRAVAANRRRLFAGNRSPMISAVESLSSSESSYSSSVADGNAEKSTSSSFDQNTSLPSPEENGGLKADILGAVNLLDNRRSNMPNDTLDNATITGKTSRPRLANIRTMPSVTNQGASVVASSSTVTPKSASSNQIQHRSVTFQVSGSSESSENGKDNFDLDLDQCKKLINNMQRNLNNKENLNSSRRGSAPCKLLLNQINAKKMALITKSRSLNKEQTDTTTTDYAPRLPVNVIFNDNENVSNPNRRGSLPIDLTLNQLNLLQTCPNEQQNNSILQFSAFETKTQSNCEARDTYAAKRRQMVQCSKLLDKNHSVDIGTVYSCSRPPMFSKCSSLRSSSFGDVGENVKNNNNINLLTTDACNAHLDNCASYNINNSGTPIDNLEVFPNTLNMGRRGSAPIHNKASLPSSSGNDRSNLNISFGSLRKGCKDPGSTGLRVKALSSTSSKFSNEKCYQQSIPYNHNSTPSLSALLARENIQAVQSRIQVLRNSSGCFLSATTPQPTNQASMESQTLIDEVVNNCINNGNGSLLLNDALSTSYSANIRRGSLPADFNFYSEFGVCQ